MPPASHWCDYPQTHCSENNRNQRTEGRIFASTCTNTRRTVRARYPRPRRPEVPRLQCASTITPIGHRCGAGTAFTGAIFCPVRAEPYTTSFRFRNSMNFRGRTVIIIGMSCRDQGYLGRFRH